MKDKGKRTIAALLAVIFVVFSLCDFAGGERVFAAQNNSITIHFKTDWGGANIFYWNQNAKYNNPVRWNGNSMIYEGNGWYVYTFENSNSVDFMLNYGEKQTTHFTKGTGEHWYAGNTWYDYKPDGIKITPTATPEPTNVVGPTNVTQPTQPITVTVQPTATTMPIATVTQTPHYTVTAMPTVGITATPEVTATIVPSIEITAAPEATATIAPSIGITAAPEATATIAPTAGATDTPVPTQGLEGAWKPIRTVAPTQAPEVTIKPSTGTITVYCKSSADSVGLYYFNVNSGTNTPVVWPGVPMNKLEEGWFGYTISNATSARLIFTTSNTETDEIYVRSGERWYVDGSIYDDPDEVPGGIPQTTVTPTAGATATVAPTETVTPTATEVPTEIVTPTATEAPTVTVAPTETVMPTEAATATPTQSLFSTIPETTATVTPTPEPTKEPVKGKIIVHYYNESSWSQPNIYYWESVGTSQVAIEWPGLAMTAENNNWYVYTIEGATSTSLLFVDGANSNSKTGDLTRKEGEWWYKGGTWYDYDLNGPTPTPGPTNTPRPTNTPKPTRDPSMTATPTPEYSEDFRDETIYFVMTARFYDGDSSNNVHCDHDAEVGNGDDDPAWRGDFKGLIERLDYIKALGFTAIWITPVVENASGYDFHGYHGVNLQKVDPRLESQGATYQDLIDAAHERGMKVIQDIVLNHTGNSGEENLFPIVDRTYNLTQGASGNSVTTTAKSSALGKLGEFINVASKGKYSDYNDPGLAADKDGATYQYQARDQWMKSEDFLWRKQVNIGWEDFTVTTGQFAGDCMELNTENPAVYNYLTETYNGYIDMGVDAFRIDTVKHISRLTMNEVFIPSFKAAAAANGNDNFFMYAEVACRVSEIFNHGVTQVSPPYYTWKSSKSYSWNHNSTDGKDNLELCKEEYNDNAGDEGRITSDNVFLNGNEYHEPDYSRSSGMGVIDYAMHFNFQTASKAFNAAKAEDTYMNDSSYNVVYVDSHDYGPAIDGKNDQDGNDLWRYEGGEQAWAENMCLMFTFRGIPCIYYGSEVEFMAGKRIDNYKEPLANTGRAYFGDYLEGEVAATDFSEYTASGAVSDTLNKPLAKHLQRLNKIRAAIPALRRGQYSTDSVNGNMAFKRRYTNTEKGIDSFVCVTITDEATFTDIPNGHYVDAVSGDSVDVTNGTLSISAPGKGNMRVYVLDTELTAAPGKVGEAGPYLK